MCKLSEQRLLVNMFGHFRMMVPTLSVDEHIFESAQTLPNDVNCELSRCGTWRVIKFEYRTRLKFQTCSRIHTLTLSAPFLPQLDSWRHLRAISAVINFNIRSHRAEVFKSYYISYVWQRGTLLNCRLTGCRGQL